VQEDAGFFAYDLEDLSLTEHLRACHILYVEAATHEYKFQLFRLWSQACASGMCQDSTPTCRYRFHYLLLAMPICIY